jgi:hypothetical protein
MTYEDLGSEVDAGPDAPLTQDGEVMARFDPRPGGYALVLEFTDLATLFEVQEVAMALNRVRDENGQLGDERVRTVAFGRALLGEAELFGHFDATLVAPTKGDLALAEQARRDWSAGRSLRQGAGSPTVKLAEGWEPSTEQLDWAERWRDAAIEPHPAGGNGPKIYTGRFLQGFNSFVTDHGREDLALSGVAGGRAVSALVQVWFDLKTVRDANGNNPHFRGVQRKAEAKASWLPGSFR